MNNRLFFLSKISFCIAGALALCLCGCSKPKDEPAGRLFERAPFQLDVKEIMSNKSGAAVVMDVRTGEVIAMHDIEKSVYRAYPPGSAFKPVAVVAAIESGDVKKEFTGNCEGKALIGGNEHRCWLSAGHGRLMMEDALARSCNIYFYTLGRKLHGRDISRWAGLFGFGKTTGIKSIADRGVESGGSLPPLIGDEDVSRFAAGDTERLLVTPLQMAVFASALANGGTVLRPYYGGGETAVVRKIGAADGIKTAVEGMRRCVTEPGGTCHALNNLGFEVAGKTGTAREAGGMKTHAWFIGFSPLEEPRVAVAVFLERGRGETDAAPAAAEIFKAYYKRAEY